MPTTTEEYVELANTIKTDLGKVKGSPQRLALFLGMRGKSEKVIIPSESKDRSNYNLEKYKFLLDAPFMISDKCCDKMKKDPARKLGKNAIIGTLAAESGLRMQKWLQYGCNAFDSHTPESKPLSFWTENDILQYIKENDLQIAKPYGEIIVKNDGIDGQINIHDFLGNYNGAQYDTSGVKRTGCIFCMFGIMYEKGRFTTLFNSEPMLADYVLRGGAFDSDGYWKPNNQGLGFWFVIKWLNVHGDCDIKMPKEKEYIEKYGNETTEKYLRKETSYDQDRRDKPTN